MMIVKAYRPALAIILFLINIKIGHTQLVQIDWEQAHGSISYEEAYDIILAPDSNLLVVGKAFPYAGDFSECGEYGGFVAIKMDTLGNIIWSRCYGGSEFSAAHSVINTSDGGYILVGETYSNDGDVTGTHGIADCWVVKLDADGNLLWEQAFGGSEYDGGADIVELSDGGYAVVVRSASTDGDVIGHHGIDYNYDAWVFTLSPAGELFWSKCFGGNDDEYGFGMVLDSDGNLVIAGRSHSLSGDVTENKGSSDVWVFKINTDGELIWSETFGGTGEDVGNQVEAIGTSYYIIGRVYSNDFDVTGNHGTTDGWLLKLDTNGNMLMQKCFGGTGGEEFFGINNSSMNEIILAGTSGSTNGDLTYHYGPSYYADYWTLSTDTLGNINWQKSLGGSMRDEAWGIVKLSSASYVTTGFSFSNDYDVTDNAGYADIWTVKLSVCNTMYYADADGDGFGNPIIDSIACSAPTGFVADSTDCNDADMLVYPTATDICNSFDDNCNGLIDEDALFITYYLDFDADGYGDAGYDSVSCSVITGYVENDLDCNDLDAVISPDAPELCNDIDDNCNVLIDDGIAIYTYYADVDGDSYGDPLTSIDTCAVGITGYVNNNLDCNDALASIFPGAEEICNYLDDDCDGIVDDNLAYTRQYEDADGDLYGNLAQDTLACLDIPGYVVDSTDCNDENPNIYPGAMEILNGLDDDCDGVSDEGLDIVQNAPLALHIYPIPATDHIIVEIAHFGKTQLYITNTVGSLVYNDTNWNHTPISVSQWPAGMYMVQVLIENVWIGGGFVKE